MLLLLIAATTVGGGYINGTAESVATMGLVWTLAPLGIFLGLTVGQSATNDTVMLVLYSNAGMPQ